MTINFERQVKEDLGTNVRAILGVPEEFLPDTVILSPVFVKKAEKFINNKIKEVSEDETNLDKTLLKISYYYYVCYLLCPGMYARLPKQMENVNTKTILLSIDWNQRALEMLNKCNETLDMALEDIGEETDFGNTFAVLTAASEYPNTTI